MNRVIFALIGIVVLALVGGTFVASNNDDSADITVNTENYTVDGEEYIGETRDNEFPVADANARPIVEYSESALAESETENNLLFFHAAWCTVCNSVERNLEAGNIPNDVTIFKVDFESNQGQKLADAYNIPIQHTMVQVTPDGSEITQWVNQFNDGVNEINAKIQRG